MKNKGTVLPGRQINKEGQAETAKRAQAKVKQVKGSRMRAGLERGKTAWQELRVTGRELTTCGSRKIGKNQGA